MFRTTTKNKRAEVHLTELVQKTKTAPLGATKFAKAMTTQSLFNPCYIIFLVIKNK